MGKELKESGKEVMIMARVSNFFKIFALLNSDFRYKKGSL